jgi:DivIVA domain-containing protein
VTHGIAFNVNLRGYDRDEVDVLVARIGAALASTDPALRESVRQDVRGASFRVALRGYDRAQVDMYVTWALAQLERS